MKEDEIARFQAQAIAVARENEEAAAKKAFDEIVALFDGALSKELTSVARKKLEREKSNVIEGSRGLLQSAAQLREEGGNWRAWRYLLYLREVLAGALVAGSLQTGFVEGVPLDRSSIQRERARRNGEKSAVKKQAARNNGLCGVSHRYRLRPTTP